MTLTASNGDTLVKEVWGSMEYSLIAITTRSTVKIRCIQKIACKNTLLGNYPQNVNVQWMWFPNL